MSRNECPCRSGSPGTGGGFEGEFAPDAGVRIFRGKRRLASEAVRLRTRAAETREILLCGSRPERLLRVVFADLVDLTDLVSALSSL